MLVLAAAACGGSAGGATQPSALGDGAITVASLNFPESEVLAELYAQALEGRGFRVHRELGLGPRELVDPALQRGLVELVPEYAGSATAFFDGSQISNGRGGFWLDSDRAGIRAVEVLLQPSCDTSGAVAVQPAPDETGTVVFARPETIEPSFTGERLLRFPGGCITYTYRFARGASSILAIEADEALGLVSRATIVAGVRHDYDETLCAAGAPPCAG